MTARLVNRSGTAPAARVRTPKAPKAKCARVPVCLLDQIREGVAVYLQKHRDGWGIYGRVEDKPIARRKHKAAAEELLAAAREEVERAAAAAAVSPLELERRRRTRVVTPQRPTGEPARYELIEADELVSSHNPFSFAPDPRYPAGVQEREYHRSPDEQRKVMIGAQNLDPAFLLTDTPSAVDGPPLVTAGTPALALGGNGRSMMIKRAYRDGAPGERYRAALLERAPDFGFSPDQVRRLAAPVLVRAINELTASSPAAELTAAVRRFNEGLTQALSPRARAVAEAKQLRPDTVAGIGEILTAAGEASLREVMRDSPAALVALLKKDGVVNDQNRSAWLAGDNLTDEAKDRLEGMFLGLVVGSGDRLNAAPPAMLRKLERAIPYLIRVRGLNPALDLIPAVQEALDLLIDATARGQRVADLYTQSSLLGLGPKASEEAKQIAFLLERAGSREIGERFKAWARVAAVDPNQRAMFWTPATPESALETLLGTRTKNPAVPHAPVVRVRGDSTEAIAAALLEQLDRAPEEWVIVAMPGHPVLIQFSGGRPHRVWVAGKERPKVCRALLSDMRERSRQGLAR